MLDQPLMDKLRQLRLSGFRTALEEQMADTHYTELAFEDRLGMLVDRECQRLENNRVRRALKAARFADSAAMMENLDFDQGRGLQRRQVLELAQGEWIRHGLNAMILGPTGVGKTFVACALGHAACRQGFRVRYLRLPRFLEDFKLAHADGSYHQLLRSLNRMHVLILDDWLRDPLTGPQTRDLAEVLEDRYGQRSTIVATQVPVGEWHARFPDPTLADTVLDRLVHNAHRLELSGESQRKQRSPLAAENN